MKKMSKKRRINYAIVIAVLIALIVSTGTVLAYFHAMSERIDNKFEEVEVTCSIDETFKDNVKSNVSVVNTGDINSFIRASVVVTWKDADGNIYGQVPVASTAEKAGDYEIEFDYTNGWSKAADGFYYYSKEVAPDDATSVLIKRCEPVEGRAPEGYYLNVEIMATAVQADGVSKGAPTGEKDQYAAEIEWANDKILIDVAKNEYGELIMTVRDNLP